MGNLDFVQENPRYEKLHNSLAYCALEIASNYSRKVFNAFLNKQKGTPTEKWKDLLASKSLQTEIKKTQDELIGIYSDLQYSFEELISNTAIVDIDSNLYPEQLKLIDDPPRVLFIKGNIGALKNKGIAIVGSRASSNEGKARAAIAAKLLSKQNYNVVSGLARGIDAAAHLSAIQNGGHTIAVIGTPINKYYPKENMTLQNKIAEAGTLVSQFSPLHPVTKINFPTRNATMSGLTLATVIVEASETSGTLTQAKHCLSQNRKLFIMQNQIDRADLKWPKKFIKLGAIPLKKIEDLTSELDNSNSSHENLNPIQTKLF